MIARLVSVVLFCIGIWCINADAQVKWEKFMCCGGTAAAACTLPTTNLVAHWTADSGVTQSGGTVSNWVDTVSSISMDQLTSANQPVYQATGYNGKPAIQFYDSTGSGGHSKSMMATSAAATSIGANSSVFWVGQILTNNDGVGFGRIWAYQANGDASDAGVHSLIDITDGVLADEVYFYGGVQGTDKGVTLNANHRLGLTYDGTTGTPYIDNVLQTTDSQTATIGATGSFGIGSNLPESGANVWINAIVREVLVYSAVLTSGTTPSLNTVDTYLTCNDGT